MSMPLMARAMADSERKGRPWYPQQSPYVSIANRQAEIMIRIAAEFGFTPASRSRISTPSANERTLFDILEGGANESD